MQSFAGARCASACDRRAPAACLFLAAKANDPLFVTNGDFRSLLEVWHAGSATTPRAACRNVVATNGSTVSHVVPPPPQALEKHLGVLSRDIMDIEFAVFEALEFNVHPPAADILAHFYRILSSFNRFSNVKEYLGEKMHGVVFLDQPA